MQTASMCRRCKMEVRDSPQTCGACGQVGKLGDRLHCFDHCLEFIKAEPDERLRQVMKYGDCTICLIRDHSTDAHMARAAGKPDKLQTCGLYDKVSETHCTSIQNASFHGSATHMRNTAQTSTHTRAFPQDTRSLWDTGKGNCFSPAT